MTASSATPNPTLSLEALWSNEAIRPAAKLLPTCPAGGRSTASGGHTALVTIFALTHCELIAFLILH